MIERIASSLRIEPREARRALGLAALLFVLTGSYTLVKTARDALYLAQLPAATLPYVYLGVGVLTTVLAALYGRATRALPTSVSLEVAMWWAAVSLAGFAALFTLGQRWVAVAFYLWANFYGVLLISQFWVFTNTLSHAREAKRIFGIIGVGGILGGLFGGLAAPPLSTAFGLVALPVAGAAIVFVACLALGARRRSVPEVAIAAREGGDGSDHALRQPYVRWLALAALCSVLVSTIVDFQFKVELQRRHPSPAELASFLGWFYTATNLAALTLQIFATRWLLQGLGAGWSAAILPAGLGLGAILTLVVPGFAAVLASRLWDQVMRLSINKSAVELFFLPLEPGVRRRAKAVIEAGLERLGDALAGVLILAVVAVMGGSTWTLAPIVLVLVAVWVRGWMRVRRGYVAELGLNLRRMSLDLRETSISLREAGMLREMERLLASPFERVVLHGMEMLEENAPERVTGPLPRLLEHASPAVRARALALAANAPTAEMLERIRGLLDDDAPEVRIAALRAQWAAGGQNRIASMREFLESDDPRVRQSALECVAEFALPAEEGTVLSLLERAMSAGRAEDRAAIARGLGRRAAPTALHELITILLEDPDLVVRRAALVAAGGARLRRAVPGLIEALGQRGQRGAARRGLASFGEGVVGTLADHLSDPGVPLLLRREIPPVLGDIGTENAAAGLMRCRERDDVRLSYRVLKAANHIRSRNPRATFARDRITEDLEHETRSYLFALVHYRLCPIGGSHSAERLLCIALNERMDQALNRLFRRLALLYSPPDVHAAYQGVTSVSPRLRGNALEYLENALGPDHRTMVLPLVDESGDDDKLRLAERRFGFRLGSYEESLREMLTGSDSWLRTCSLYVVGSRREREFLPWVEDQIASREPHVRETALWARVALMGA